MRRRTALWNPPLRAVAAPVRRVATQCAPRRRTGLTSPPTRTAVVLRGASSRQVLRRAVWSGRRACLDQAPRGVIRRLSPRRIVPSNRRVAAVPGRCRIAWCRRFRCRAAIRQAHPYRSAQSNRPTRAAAARSRSAVRFRAFRRRGAPADSRACSGRGRLRRPGCQGRIGPAGSGLGRSATRRTGPAPAGPGWWAVVCARRSCHRTPYRPGGSPVPARPGPVGFRANPRPVRSRDVDCPVPRNASRGRRETTRRTSLSAPPGRARRRGVPMADSSPALRRKSSTGRASPRISRSVPRPRTPPPETSIRPPTARSAHRRAAVAGARCRGRRACVRHPDVPWGPKAPVRLDHLRTAWFARRPDPLFAAGWVRCRGRVTSSGHPRNSSSVPGRMRTHHPDALPRVVASGRCRAGARSVARQARRPGGIRPTVRRPVGVCRVSVLVRPGGVRWISGRARHSAGMRPTPGSVRRPVGVCRVSGSVRPDEVRWVPGQAHSARVGPVSGPVLPDGVLRAG